MEARIDMAVALRAYRYLADLGLARGRGVLAEGEPFVLLALEVANEVTATDFLSSLRSAEPAINSDVLEALERSSFCRVGGGLVVRFTFGSHMEAAYFCKHTLHQC